MGMNVKQIDFGKLSSELACDKCAGIFLTLPIEVVEKKIEPSACSHRKVVHVTEKEEGELGNGKQWFECRDCKKFLNIDIITMENRVR